MTSFNSPDRPMLGNGVKCWMTNVHLALPSLYVRPFPDPSGNPTFRISLMLAIEWNTASWRHADVAHADLEKFFVAWAADPEFTLRDWFNEAPPGNFVAPELGAKPQPVRTTTSLEDFLA